MTISAKRAILSCMRVANKPFARELGVSPSRLRKRFNAIGLDFNSDQSEQLIRTMNGVLHASRATDGFFDIPGANLQILQEALCIYPPLDLKTEQSLSAYSLRKIPLFNGYKYQTLATSIEYLKQRVPKLFSPHEWEHDTCSFKIPGCKDSLTVYRRRSNTQGTIVVFKNGDDEKVRRALGILEAVIAGEEISLHTKEFASECNMSEKKLLEELVLHFGSVTNCKWESKEFDVDGDKLKIFRKWNKTRPAFVININDLVKAKLFFGEIKEHDPIKEVRLTSQLYRQLSNRSSSKYQFLARDTLADLVKEHIGHVDNWTRGKEFFVNKDESFSVYLTKNGGQLALTIAKRDLTRFLKYIKKSESLQFRDRISHDSEYRSKFQGLTIEDTDNLNGLEFEHLIQKLFLDSGYKVEITPSSGDYGADLIVEKNGVSTVIQCKRRNSKAGIRAVQEVYTAKDFYDLDAAVVITNNDYTNSAKEIAIKLGVLLLDRSSLQKWIAQSHNFDRLFSIGDYE